MKNELCTKCSKTNNFRAKTCEFALFKFGAKIQNSNEANFHENQIFAATKMRFFFVIFKHFGIALQMK